MTVSLRIPPETLRQRHERDDMPHTRMDEYGQRLKPSKILRPCRFVLHAPRGRRDGCAHDRPSVSFAPQL